MKTIWLIIEREFLIRVKKKSFIITTLVVPLLFAAFMVAMVLLMTMKDSDLKKIVVLDQTHLFANEFKESDNLKFTYADSTASFEEFKKTYKEEYFGVLNIEANPGGELGKITLFSDQQISLDLQNDIARQMRSVLERRKLAEYNIQDLDKILDGIRKSVSITTIQAKEDGQEQESFAGASMAIAYVLSFIIYMAIFMFGSQVMRGVIEEKTNRIVEVIISSVKPFQLMMGKVIGVGLVGLLQFIIWIVFGGVLVMVFQSFIGGGDPQAVASAMPQVSAMPLDIAAVSKVNDVLSSIPFVTIIGSFLCYFLGGYLLYSSLFAAIGSAVDQETDTQQLMFPITIPLILGLFIMLHTFQHPNSALSFWASIIPFTSPMVMMARVPFGVPAWELALSLGLLVITFILFTALSAKIYRVGILMYGKKPSLKEMWKWVKYKN